MKSTNKKFMAVIRKSGLGRASRGARVCFFIFLAISLFTFALYGLLSNEEFVKQLMESDGSTSFEGISSDEITAILVGALFFLALAALMLLIWIIGAHRIKRENQENIDTNRRIKMSGKKKAKPLLIIFGPIVFFASLFIFTSIPSFYDPNPEIYNRDKYPGAMQTAPYNIFMILCIILMILGLVMFIYGLSIKTRRHRGHYNIARENDGDKLIVTFKELNAENFPIVYQDTVNDGYTELYDVDGLRVTFRTKFTQKELQAQYDLREKYFEAKDAKKDAIRNQMPNYFSDDPTIYSKYSKVPDGEPYRVRTPHYKSVLVRTEWTEVTHEDGSVTREDEHDVYEDVLDYYTLDTIQHFIDKWHFFHKDTDEPLLLAVTNTQFYIYYTYSEIIESVRI